MSEETTRKLEIARSLEAEQRAAVDEQVTQCLALIARNIPDRIDAIAKRTALGQPEVAKELGSKGIAAMRSELADAAAVLASKVTEAGDKIDWPNAPSGYSPVRERDVHSAIFNFLYGGPLSEVAAIVKRHGFSIGDQNAQRAQSFILPQQLYDEDDFSALAEALTALTRAETAVAAAKTADDEDVVESLWDD